MDHAKKFEVLRSLSGEVTRLTAKHERPLSELWMPSQLLIPFFENVLSSESMARVEAITYQHRAALALNLLTEDGLPHFHRLVATHLGDEGPWAKWNNLWTAEENRHGNALDAYVMLTGVVDREALDRMKYLYIREGFYPDWKHDPYQLLAYTSLQERATQISHRKLGRGIEQVESVLGEVLKRIASDEARHYVFYRQIFRNVLASDTDAALVSLHLVMAGFAMPGESAPHFGEMKEVQERADIFTTRDYLEIVQELNVFWNIEKLKARTPEGQQAQGAILRLPRVLERMADRQDKNKKTPRRFELPFLKGEVTL